MMMNDRMLAHMVRSVDLPDLSATHYELRDEIGRGGMGVVYRAFDTRLAREVAMKVTESADAGEARVAASLEHPGIAPVYDVGSLPDGRVFQAMRLIRGKPLQDRVTPGTPLSERVAIFQKVCEAVAFAHSCRVIHRDLKPANVMVGAFGEVTVLDWGAAQEGVVAGTPAFMAPEHARGEAPTPLDDVYSLGALLAWLLPPGSPKPLHAIAARAMQKDAPKRYPGVEEIRLDISRHLDGFSVEAYRENPAERTVRFIRRNRVLFLLFGAYFAARIAVYIFSGR